MINGAYQHIATLGQPSADTPDESPLAILAAHSTIDPASLPKVAYRERAQGTYAGTAAPTPLAVRPAVDGGSRRQCRTETVARRAAFRSTSVAITRRF
jgi:hypothetical protein